MQLQSPVIHRLLLIATCALTVVGTYVLCLATRDPIINRSNYDAIKLGMEESDVDKLLKGTSIDLAPLNFKDVAVNETAEALVEEYPPPHTVRSWKSDTYMISVMLDSEGRVAAKYYQRAPEANVIDRLADWLGI